MIVRRGQNQDLYALFRQVLAENMELDWQCDHPNTELVTNSEPMEQTPSDPNVEYIFNLCSSIKEKLELLEQAAGREELGEYAW